MLPEGLNADKTDQGSRLRILKSGLQSSVFCFLYFSNQLPFVRCILKFFAPLIAMRLVLLLPDKSVIST